jgi:hypothetical protein
VTLLDFDFVPFGLGMASIRHGKTQHDEDRINTFFFLTFVTFIGSGVLTPASGSRGGITSSPSTSYTAKPPPNGVAALLVAAANKDEFKIDGVLIEDEGVDPGLLS